MISRDHKTNEVVILRIVEILESHEALLTLVNRRKRKLSWTLYKISWTYQNNIQKGEKKRKKTASKFGLDSTGTSYWGKLKTIRKFTVEFMKMVHTQSVYVPNEDKNKIRFYLLSD